MTKVAVIGGGAAGIGAARELLRAGMQVTLLEAAPRIGGNCLGIEVPTADGGRARVDAGVTDFNRVTFHQVSRLIDELGLPTRPIDTDTSFASPSGATLLACSRGRYRFARPIADPESVVGEIEAFRHRAMEVLEDERFARWTTGRYLDHLGASPEFRNLYLYPRAIGCFPMLDCGPQRYPIRELVRFWNMHGMVSRQPMDRRCVVGGMHRYPVAFADWFLRNGGELHCGTRVIGITRGPWSVEVRTVDRADRHHSLAVNHVVLANNPHDSLHALEDPSREEYAFLAGFRYQRARVVVHRDRRLLGDDASARGAFNYVVPEGDLPRVRPTITFFPNKLAALPAEIPDTYVTMNPHLEPRPETVIASRFFQHPLGHVDATRWAAGLTRIQGRHRTWFAGAGLVPPFVHESALVSGITAARGIVLAEQGRSGEPTPVDRLAGIATVRATAS